MACTFPPLNIIRACPCAPSSRNKKPWMNQRSSRKGTRCEVGNGDGGRRRSAVVSWAGEYDLYSLLGVGRTSEAPEIRKAYRALQKRCHPDIAGPAGHDMAILLNQIYSVLSDPASRDAYDRERSKHLEFHGYTGRPIYSKWLGHEAEQRAVFVDEVKCIGCLKCALHANNTFAIESVYGRARVVAQWADSEDQIFDAIKTCPVDCISVVERSDLAALEFLMSKQPRGNVRMTGENSVGVLVADVFDEVKKFRKKFDEMNGRASARNSQEADLQRKSRASAMDAVSSISNWLYRQKFSSGEAQLSLTDSSTKSLPPNPQKLQEAVAKLKARAAAGFSNRATSSHEHEEEYWTPLLTLPTQSTRSSNNSSEFRKPRPRPSVINEEEEISSEDRTKHMDFGIPLSMAVVSVIVNGSKGGGSNLVHGLEQHIGGSMALAIVNSFELRVVLAGITWFFVGLVVVTVGGFLGEKDKFRR